MNKEDISEEEICDDTNFYSHFVREALMEDDELSPYEDAFMQGYEDAS